MNKIDSETYTNKERCSHGIAYSCPCEYCELISLKESLQWMERKVIQDNARVRMLENRLFPNKRRWVRVEKLREKISNDQG